MEPPRYTVDPRDPRAPSQELWDRLSEAERQRIVERLSSEFPRAEPPEGDRHRKAKVGAFEALDEYYRRIRRRIYISSELPIYYPDKPVFAPDLIAVRDVEAHERSSWVVSHEGRGLDFALEVHVAGRRRKDLDFNVERHARLGIPEYFVFDPLRTRLTGFRLSEPDADRYETIVPHEGRWSSAVLELDLALDAGRLRFYHGNAPLLDARELIGRLSEMVDDAVRRAEQETSRAEEEASRAEEEASRAERLAARLRELGVDPDDLQ